MIFCSKWLNIQYLFSHVWLSQPEDKAEEMPEGGVMWLA